ncbi:MAG: impB/mucB/samB family protein [Oceanospirillaceae bacterium]|nr:impB/mucB/samB family protein [Oceanospirillaceae bacterium]
MHPTSTDLFSWLFLDLNSYFASVEQQLNPELRGKPVAVVPLETDATCAIAASYEAKKHGVKTGTKIYDAKRMCPDLVCVQARHDAYTEFHHKILEEVERHIPITVIASIDEVGCELWRGQQTEAEARALALRIKQGMARNVGEAITCSIGISSNRYLAKIATEMQKPDGLIVLRPEELPARIHHFDLTDLTGISKGYLRRLHRHGIHTVEQLFALEPKHMRRIWGSVGGERFWYALHGVQLPDQETQRRTVGHSHMLSPEWRPPNKAYVVAQRLLLKAASRLRRLGYLAGAMDVSIRQEYGDRLHVDARFRHACDNVALKSVLRESWEAIMQHNQGRRVKKVSITLHGLIPQGARQPDLFDQEDDSTQRREQASVAMDTLNAKYGRDTVVMGFLPQNDHPFAGTKIAFTRIPEREEFHE